MIKKGNFVVLSIILKYFQNILYYMKMDFFSHKIISGKNKLQFIKAFNQILTLTISSRVFIDSSFAMIYLKAGVESAMFWMTLEPQKLCF